MAYLGGASRRQHFGFGVSRPISGENDESVWTDRSGDQRERLPIVGRLKADAVWLKRVVGADDILTAARPLPLLKSDGISVIERRQMGPHR